MRNRIWALIAALAAVALLSGCSSKQIDLAAAQAQQVPGSGNLFRFCDGATLIYFSNYGSGSSDDYEAFFYGGCVDGKPALASAEPGVDPNLPGQSQGGDQAGKGGN